MALKIDSAYVDRSPAKSPRMKEAYAGLAAAEAALAEAHSYGYATGDWEPHGEAVRTMVEWHHEIALIAHEERR